MKRSEILDTAKEYVTKDRASQHGDAENNLNGYCERLGLVDECHVTWKARSAHLLMWLVMMTHFKDHTGLVQPKQFRQFH
jgi:hypothetical protein